VRYSSRLDWLAQVGTWNNVLVITGAGCSVPSGIPAYRDADGQWRHRAPVTYREFMESEHVRRRYWARSTRGWQLIERAEPNQAHQALARLEQEGYIRALVTQNVDGLHARAGSRKLMELHGGLASVACTRCAWRGERGTFQADLLHLNPELGTDIALIAPDGDAHLEDGVYATFQVPSCHYCDGVIKPDVVFFGEAVPVQRVHDVKDHVSQCDALLVIGSSLTVFSGFRFVKLAASRGLPIAVLNLGSTRADHLGAHHLDASVEDVLPELVSIVVARKALV